MKRKPRVRLQLIDAPGVQLPTLEGLLVSRRRREYMIAVPRLLVAPEANPVEPDARLIAVPRERVAWLEVI